MLAFGVLKNAEDVAFLHDEKVFAVDLDFCAGPLAEENAVAFFHIESDELALLIASAGADCATASASARSWSRSGSASPAAWLSSWVSP